MVSYNKTQYTYRNVRLALIGLLIAVSASILLLNISPAQAASSPKFISWSRAAVDTLLTTPLTADIDGVPVAVSTSISPGDTTGTHIDGYTGFSYLFDGVWTYNPVIADMQITTGRTLTAELVVEPGKLSDIEIYVHDAEISDFRVYARDNDDNLTDVSSWVVSSQEKNGTIPADKPNPYVVNANDIAFSAINGQNDDFMKIRINRADLATINKIYIEFTSGGTRDWIQWVFRGTRVDDPPIVQDDSFTATKNQPVVVAPLGNDTEPDGGSLMITHIGGQPVTIGVPILLLAPFVTITLQSDGTLRIVPAEGYVGVLTFSYTVSDGDERADGTVTIEFIDNPASDSVDGSSSDHNNSSSSDVLVPLPPSTGY